ncbi:MAG: DNA topoisomerase I [Xanthobacteraceae bacterium]|nr:MAG: DNA topoisomerase I [Xanthobacteraceae bacterium]
MLSALNDSLGPHIFPDKGDGSNPRACPTCGSGTLSLKLGKFGAFVGCSNYPECRYTRQLAAPSADAVDGPASAAAGTRKLGDDPASGLEVTVRDGRFGPYVQLGDGEKPKRSSLPKGMTPAGLDLERALALLELPKEVAKHPESGEPILVGIGRYGPYVQHGRTYANLEKDDDVLAIGANRAIDLVIAKESGAKSRFGRGSAPAGRELGDHPTLGGPVTVMAGRYGPYVKHGAVNATLPKGKDPASLTMDEALPLLAARAESAGSAKKGFARGKAAKSSGDKAATGAKAKAPAKKVAAKKPAARKAAKPKE